MATSPEVNGGMLSHIRNRTMKERTIVVGLNSDNCSREMLLRLLNSVVMPGDNVLTVHVLEPNDTFDPNTFHIHEDLCKSRQVDFQVKVCGGDSYITGLTHQVRINYATILAIGCSLPWPKNSTVVNCLKALPPTCSLLVMDNGGRILMQRQGTSQEGSASKVLQSCQSTLSKYRYPEQSTSYPEQSTTGSVVKKSLTIPSPSKSPSLQQSENLRRCGIRKAMQLPDFLTQKLFERLAILEINGFGRRFTSEEISCATNGFSPEMVIGEGGNSKVYLAMLDDGRSTAVKVLKIMEHSAENLFREVEMLSCLKHENIVQLIGYCCSQGMHAIVYNLLKENLRQKLEHLRWRERMRIAMGVAKALDYLHSQSPPIIHRDVKSSNILLSDNCQPQAKSLLSCSLCERLIDPHLNQDYDKDEMKTMMIAARLCLLHSSSRRPTIKTILQFFEEPEQWLKMQRKRDELLNGISSKGESGFYRYDSSDSIETSSVDSN